MGFMDSIKKATGLGLSPEQHYERAYEKAVLLGEDKYKEAVVLFQTAADKATEVQDERIALRATANAALYGFVTGTIPFSELHQALSQIDEIEQVGSQTEMMATAPIVQELAVRLIEEQVNGCRSDEERAAAHRKAAAAFKTIFSASLWTYQFRPAPKHNDSGQSRFFSHLGKASWYDAVNAAMRDPETAAEHMAKALNAFGQCGDEEWVSNSQAWLRNCRVRRSCWMCHREFQGDSLHFRSFQAYISPYTLAVVESLGQDVSSLSIQTQSLVLCEPCGSAVEHVADRLANKRVNELRDELIQQLNSRFGEIDQSISGLDSRLERVERISHRH